MATVHVNIALRNKILDCLFNGAASVHFFDNGTIEFRTGAMPATADLAATGVVIASVPLPVGAMGVPASGTIQKTNVSAWEDASADNTGTIGYARFKSQDTTLVMDADATSQAVGTGAILVDNPAVVAGQDIIVTAFSLTMPAST